MLRVVYCNTVLVESAVRTTHLKSRCLPSVSEVLFASFCFFISRFWHFQSGLGVYFRVPKESKWYVCVRYARSRARRWCVLRQRCADAWKRSTATGSVVPAGCEMPGISFGGNCCIHLPKIADHILCSPCFIGLGVKRVDIFHQRKPHDDML